MGFDIKYSNIPRGAKFVIFGFLLVSVIVFLMNRRVPYSYWRDNYYDTTPVHRESAFNEEKAHFMSRKKLMTKRKFGNETGEVISKLKMLVVDPTGCFKKYETETAFSASQGNYAYDETPSFFYMLFTFNKLMASLNIKAAIIEPSVIHCMLETKYKDLLKKRNFNLTEFTGLNSTITYGAIGHDVDVLQTEDTIQKFRSHGLQPYFHQVPLADWMLTDKARYGSGHYPSHIFYSYYEWTIHVVVFHTRNSYLWHAELSLNDTLNIPRKDDLLFVSHDSAYEIFDFIPLEEKWPSLADVYIPSNPHHFLFQIPVSRFLECNLTRAVRIEELTSSTVDSHHNSVNKFKSRMLVGLRELKELFNPLLMHFWIFAGTMLGWYRQCDIIPYTSDVDFGAWVSEVDDLDSILKYLRKNKNLTIRERMGLKEEALEFNLNSDGLRIDVFFLYKISNGSWASGHRPSKGYYFRYYYPHFTLCSTELLQQKVQVPCETEDVIVTEYGPGWMEPVKSWYYESSIHNRGPNIYWDEKRRPKVFEEY